MTYAMTMDVPAPVEVYDAVHREVLARSGGTADGLLVHLARATEGGFQVIEVWESRDQCERYSREIVGPVLAEVTRGAPQPPEAPAEFEVRGLVLPRAGVVV
ncbi:hypothetical protein [Trujillonella endophytica]|uniref:Antibiotic biosynthesis monooxygenase n=1 Tax=Trujillonella endophytica TaxID=673521 RepID=A0A1H8QXV4_9ACTN|nr:hypothetical protein [Trujillella endophytica]SEO59170.1 hypothetical protein SAMN05660991_00882 [Trujillella endophytica]